MGFTLPPFVFTIAWFVLGAIVVMLVLWFILKMRNKNQ